MPKTQLIFFLVTDYIENSIFVILDDALEF